MADNYLERKMEDLKRGAPLRALRSPHGSRKGFIQFPFPPRKVMIAGVEEESSLAIIRSFIKTDSKVAFVSTDKTAGTNFAAREGVRFVAVSDYKSGDIERALDEIIKAWRDIDIIISTPLIARLLAEKWNLHLDSPFIPRDYKGRLIIIGSIDGDEIYVLSNMLQNRNIAVNAITTGETDKSSLPRLLLFLSLPDNESIAGNRIEIK